MSICNQPTNRYAYNLITTGSKVYIVGGSKQVLDIWYLDLSTGLSTTSCPSWNVYSNIDNASTALGPYYYGVGFNINSGSTIYYQAGDTNVDVMTYLKPFDTIIGRSSTITIAAKPLNRSQMSATVDSNNNIWYYGGRSMFDLNGNTGNQSTSAFNDYYNFNINNNVLTSQTVQDSKPYGERPGRFGHTATIVEKKIFMLGGYTLIGGKDTIFEFDSAQVFDIATQQTISMVTIGDIPAAKRDFSAVPANDGKSIIIFGGASKDAPYTVSNDVYILDTCTLTWKKQQINQSTQSRAGHQAFMYGKYMITMLGVSSYGDGSGTPENNVAILDTESWTWVTSIPSGYQPNTNPMAPAACSFSFPILPTTNQEHGDASKLYDQTVISNPNAPRQGLEELTTPQKAGIGVGVPLFFLLVLGIGIFFYIRRRNLRKNRQLNPRWMPGVFGNNNNNNVNGNYPPPHLNGTSSIPLSTTSNNNTSPSSSPAVIGNQPTGLKTYTATDLDQWERQLIQDKDHPQSDDRVQARHADLWNKFRGDLAPDVERR